MATACIGLISDTHGLVRPQALVALEGVDLILHAGDVCGEGILEELAGVAPTFAVGGNCDTDPKLPPSILKVVAGVRILVHHGHRHLNEAVHRPDVVVTGHTHVPLIETVDGVLRVNPGSAGPHRFSLPVTLARLDLSPGKRLAELIELDVR